MRGAGGLYLARHTLKNFLQAMTLFAAAFPPIAASRQEALVTGNLNNV